MTKLVAEHKIMDLLSIKSNICAGARLASDQASCDLIVAKSANLDVDPSIPADRLHPYLAASLKLWL